MPAEEEAGRDLAAAVRSEGLGIRMPSQAIGKASAVFQVKLLLLARKPIQTYAKQCLCLYVWTGYFCSVIWSWNEGIHMDNHVQVIGRIMLISLFRPQRQLRRPVLTNSVTSG